MRRQPTLGSPRILVRQSRHATLPVVATPYTVTWEPRARRNRDALPADVVKNLTDLGNALGADPRPHGSIQMKGRRDKLRRVRAGSYRLMYYADDTARTIRIVDADHRKDIYR